MINEFKLILDGLEALDIEIAPTHKTLTKAGGKEAVRVVLDKDDNDRVFISHLEYMDKEDIDAIWVLGDGNKNHFPDIKLTRPLRPNGNDFYANYLKNKKLEPSDLLSSDDIAKLIDKNISSAEKNRLVLERYPTATKVNFDGLFPGEGYRQKIVERYKLLSQSTNPKVLTASSLLELFINFDNDGHLFLQSLDKAIETTLISTTIDDNFAKLLFTILYGNKPIKESGDLQDGANDRVKLVIDYQPDPDIDIYASNANYYKNAISAHLVKLDSNDTSNDNKPKLICPIYGETDSLVQKTFPKIKTNTLLGNITPYARFDNSGSKTTVHRYHRSGTDAYTVDKAFSNKLDSLVNLLTSKDNRNKTWRPIASENPDQNDVLIAFCHEYIELPVLQLVANDDSSWEVEDFQEYIENTSELISLIKAKSVKPNALTSFIILRKVDTANQKVIFSAQYTVAELEVSALRWVEAVKNTPSLKLPIFIEKTVKVIAPWSLSPEQLVQLSKHTYDRDGEESKARVPAISFDQAMRLFFEQGSHLILLTEQLLTKICQQTQWLFNYCAIHKTISISSKSDKITLFQNKNVLMYTTTISLLLYKLNRPKELYMTSLSYQLGQYCSAMNELHLGYCESERGGSIPSTLLGSSAYSMALQSPSRALDYLSQRITPYDSWVKKQQAKKSKDGKYEKSATNHAIFAHNWMQRHANALMTAFIAQQERPLSKTHTAELMLGYLAGRDFVEKKTNTDSPETTA